MAIGKSDEMLSVLLSGNLPRGERTRTHTHTHTLVWLCVNLYDLYLLLCNYLFSQSGFISECVAISLSCIYKLIDSCIFIFLSQRLSFSHWV